MSGLKTLLQQNQYGSINRIALYDIYQSVVIETDKNGEENNVPVVKPSVELFEPWLVSVSRDSLVYFENF